MGDARGGRGDEVRATGRAGRSGASLASWAPGEPSPTPPRPVSARSARFALGLRAGGGEASWVPDESPHLLVTGATGGGKGGLIRLVASSALEQGWLVSVLDPKAPASTAGPPSAPGRQEPQGECRCRGADHDRHNKTGLGRLKALLGHR
jgi:hypothetical protein